MPERDPELAAAYARLGLAPGADAAAVKAAFRRLARGLHPDHNPAAPAGGMAALNADYARLCEHLARTAGARSYAYDMWAPLSGEREFRLDTWAPPTSQTAFSGETWAEPTTETAMSDETWAPPSAQGDYCFETFAPDRPPARPQTRTQRPAPSPPPSPQQAARPEPAPAPSAGLGPLAADPPNYAANLPDLAPARPLRRETPPPPPPPPAAWRLTGVNRAGGRCVYRVEVSGRPDHVVIPLRARRDCPACAGAGQRLDGNGPCPACAGRGDIVAGRLLRVDLPPAWQPGQRLALEPDASVPPPPAGAGTGLVLELAAAGRGV